MHMRIFHGFLILGLLATCSCKTMREPVSTGEYDEAFSHEAVEKHTENRIADASEIECFRCSTQDTDSVLFPCRKGGESLRVCVKCLPPLIHG